MYNVLYRKLISVKYISNFQYLHNISKQNAVIY